jgi:Uri superfamily endonuclease
MLEATNIETKSGTYVLVFYSALKKQIQIGKLGKFLFSPGFYLYIGSAFGAGGLRARIRCHLRKSKKTHWHIDYLRSEIDIFEVWFSIQGKKQECYWVSLFESMRGITCPVPKLGSSDCSCRSHLFYCSQKPNFLSFQSHIRSDLERVVVRESEIAPAGNIKSSCQILIRGERRGSPPERVMDQNPNTENLPGPVNTATHQPFVGKNDLDSRGDF